MPGGVEGEYKRWGIDNYIDLYNALETLQNSKDFVYFVIGSDERERDIKPIPVEKVNGAVQLIQNLNLNPASFNNIMQIKQPRPQTLILYPCNRCLIGNEFR